MASNPSALVQPAGRREWSEHAHALPGGRAAGPAGVQVLVNGDDDNHNGVPDYLESAVLGEDDLLELRLVLEPQISGVVTLTTNTPGAPFAIWVDVAKSSSIRLPASYVVPSAALPSHIFVEALGTGSASVSVTLTAPDGTSIAGPRILLDLTQLLIRIVTPAEGADFVVDRAAGTTVVAEASWTDATTPSVPSWTVTPGAHSGDAPQGSTGTRYEFLPQPEAHSSFLRGNNSCATCAAAWWIAEGNQADPNCGHGCSGHRYGPSPRFSYRITANLDGGTRSIDLVQDEIDAILQQYIEHRLLGATIVVPRRPDFVAATVGAGYWGDVFRLEAYNYTLGDPEPFANDVLAAYRRYANDEEIVPNAYGQFVGVGAPFIRSRRGIPTPTGTFDLPLRTPLCWNGTAVVPGCGDVLDNGVISAGPTGVAHTRLRVVNYNLTVTSAWRSPEHNEAVGGVLDSRHQLANALDMKPRPNNPLPSDEARTWCLLLYAAGTVQREGLVNFHQTERGPGEHWDCDQLGVSHVHVDIHRP